MCTQHFFPFLFLDMYFSLFILQQTSQRPPAAAGAEAMVDDEPDDQHNSNLNLNVRMLYYWNVYWLEPF